MCDVVFVLGFHNLQSTHWVFIYLFIFAFYFLHTITAHNLYVNIFIIIIYAYSYIIQRNNVPGNKQTLSIYASHKRL
ncbi:hypothetical protein J3Q64DRAFT_1721805, partial [Phycomyces blakesleeanus]